MTFKSAACAESSLNQLNQLADVVRAALVTHLKQSLAGNARNEAGGGDCIVKISQRRLGVGSLRTLARNEVAGVAIPADS